MKPRFLIQAAASLLLLAALAPAQTQQERGRRSGPGGPREGGPPDPQQMLQRRIDRLASSLNLTEAQKPQATAIFGDAAKATQTLHQQMREARTALRDAIQANNAGQIDQLSNTLGGLTAQITAIDSKAEAQFLTTLTPDQKAQHASEPFGMPGGGPGFAPEQRRGPPPVRQ